MSTSAERMREAKRTKEIERSTEEALRDTFNLASQKLINQFMAQVMAGSIVIDDVADLTRLFQIYGQINNINQLSNEGGGTLPAMSSGQKEIIQGVIPTEKSVIDGEEADVVSLDELAEMSDEDIEKMLESKELQMNQENEATF